MKRIVLIFITAVLLLTGAVWVAAEDVGREEQAPPLPEMMESAEDGETGGATSQSEVTSPLPETAEIAEDGETEVSPSLRERLNGWAVYVKDELLPIAVAVLTVVAAVYVAISPILAKIKKASEKFKDATADVNAATGTVRRNKEQIEDMEARFSERLAAMEADSAANREELKDVKEMLRLGLGNMNELVAKGQARQILLIGKDKRGGAISQSEVTPPLPETDGAENAQKEEDVHEESSNLQA